MNLPVVAAAVQLHIHGNAIVEAVNDPIDEPKLRFIDKDAGYIAEVGEEFVFNVWACLGAANYAKRLAETFENWLCEREDVNV